MKIEGGKRGGVEGKRGPAWSALSVRSCERARMRLHRGALVHHRAPTVAASKRARQFLSRSSTSPSHPLVAPIAFPLYLPFFCVRRFYYRRSSFPCVTSAARSRRNIRLSPCTGPIANLRFRAWSNADAIACRGPTVIAGSA